MVWLSCNWNIIIIIIKIKLVGLITKKKNCNIFIKKGKKEKSMFIYLKFTFKD